MELKITREEFSKKKLMVCTPMYGGQCTGVFTQSMLKLQGLCQQYGIGFSINFLFNESLIQRARTYLTDSFMRSDCTHLLFIDSDIQFDANDVLFLLGLQTDESPYDIIGGAYPKKTISWEKVKQAVDAGAADKNPADLENFVGDFVFNPVLPEDLKEGQAYQLRLDEPVEIMELGTGFMMIRRKSLENWEDAHSERLYLPDHVRTKDFDGSRQIYEYFTVKVDPKSKRLLSEDYQLCHEFRDLGMKVWLCPWMRLGHLGSYLFGGSLPALAGVGAAATADPSKLVDKR